MMVMRDLEVATVLVLVLVFVVLGGEVYDNTWVSSSSSSSSSSGSSNSNSYNDKTEIFLSIASYRDGRCPKTIQTAFKTAKYPDRVKVSS